MKLMLAILAIVAGIICFLVSRKHGLKYPVLWLFAGIVFHFFAVGAVFFVASRAENHKKEKLQ